MCNTQPAVPNSCLYREKTRENFYNFPFRQRQKGNAESRKEISSKEADLVWCNDFPPLSNSDDAFSTSSQGRRCLCNLRGMTKWAHFVSGNSTATFTSYLWFSSSFVHTSSECNFLKPLLVHRFLVRASLFFLSFSRAFLLGSDFLLPVHITARFYLHFPLSLFLFRRLFYFPFLAFSSSVA